MLARVANGPPCACQKIGIGDFVRSRNVTPEKIAQVRVGCGSLFANHFLHRGAQPFTVIVETAALCVFVIERAHHIVETRAIVGPVADQNIQHDADDLALVVIRDAFLGAVVERIFFVPRIEAGLLDALPAMRGARFAARRSAPPRLA